MTLDRAAVLVDGQIGRTRYVTPEGFLYCEGVRIARTGPMLYRPDEVPDIDPGGNRMVVVERDADVLFAEDAIASFNGKPVTNDHPPVLLTPGTYQKYTAGTVLNPRRGEGVEADYLIADLMITDEAAIQDVLDGKVEVSCGYDARREQIKPGLARQTCVIGNHVALVDRGRAGPACAIQDKEADMAVKKRSAWDRLRTAFKANDEAAFEEELQAAQGEPDGDEPQRIVIEVKPPEAAAPTIEDEGEPDPIAALSAKIDALIDLVGKLVPVEKAADEEPEQSKADEPEKTDDEDPAAGSEGGAEKAAKEDDYPAMDAAAEADVRAKAEIIFPGVELPMMDAKSAPRVRAQAMHGLRVKALTAAYADDKRKAPVVAALGGAKADFASMSFDTAAVVFNAAAAVASSANNARPINLDHRVFPQGPVTAKELAERYKQRRAG